MLGTSTAVGRKRSETLFMKIDPKLKYLAEIAARDEDRSLSGFVDRALRLALETKGKRDNDEPNVSEPVAPPANQLLWFEGIYDEDEATRFFKLAVSRHDLLSVGEQLLWKLLTDKLSENGGKITLKRFIALWDEFIGGARRNAGIEE